MSRPDSPSTDDAGQAAEESDLLADVPPTDQHPILLFDGVCNLCNSIVQFVVERDAEGTFRFASLQSPVGQALLEEHDLPTDDFDTFVLIEGGEAYTKSEGGLRAARHFDGLYPLLRHFLVLPRPIRDAVYNLVANNRYDWFGRKDACMLPSGDVGERFLDDGVGPEA
ncbi:thiol-disulfide oxidoreductase DCC family protein [Halobacteria archaeon HArc-gm2]|nr:thiol-disulfide oxidoreductase DCC family protein [Halobacteria archaeon HArc-gm2]